MRTVLTMAKRVQSITSDMAHCVYQIYTVLKLFELQFVFHIFLFFRNFYCGYAQRDNYDKQSLNLDFRHGAHCVYHIYSVLKLFELEVCLQHYIVFEICPAMMRTVLTMANRV